MEIDNFPKMPIVPHFRQRHAKAGPSIGCLRDSKYHYRVEVNAKREIPLGRHNLKFVGNF